MSAYVEQPRNWLANVPLEEFRDFLVLFLTPDLNGVLVVALEHLAEPLVEGDDLVHLGSCF